MTTLFRFSLLVTFLVAANCFSTTKYSDSKRSQTSLSASSDDADKFSRRTFLVEAGIAAAAILPARAALAAEDEDNDFIKELKARSDANKAKYDQQARLTKKLSGNQFSSQYDRPKFVAIRRVDGSFKLVSPETLADLQSKGLVIEEYDNRSNKDGEIIPDYKKGKIFQFANAEAQAKVDKATSPAPTPAPAPEPEPVPEPTAE